MQENKTRLLYIFLSAIGTLLILPLIISISEVSADLVCTTIPLFDAFKSGFSEGLNFDVYLLVVIGFVYLINLIGIFFE